MYLFLNISYISYNQFLPLIISDSSAQCHQEHHHSNFASTVATFSKCATTFKMFSSNVPPVHTFTMWRRLWDVGGWRQNRKRLTSSWAELQHGKMWTQQRRSVQSVNTCGHSSCRFKQGVPMSLWLRSTSVVIWSVGTGGGNSFCNMYYVSTCTSRWLYLPIEFRYLPGPKLLVRFLLNFDTIDYNILYSIPISIVPMCKILFKL